MPGTAFSTSNWTGYDEQSVTNPSSALTDFTLLIDLSRMSSTWKSNVQSDGLDIRVTKGDDTEIPYDLLDWSYSAGPTVTGWIRCKWTGTLAASGTQNVRVWAGYTGGTATGYDANETYGSDNAYDSSTLAYLPMDEGSGTNAADRTSNNNDGTLSGATWGTGQVGGCVDFDGTNDQISLGASLFSSDVLTIQAWLQFDVVNSYKAVFSVYTSNTDSMEIFVNNSSSRLFGGNFSNQALSASSSISTSGWYNAALVSNGTTTQMYIGGATSGTTGTTNFSTFTPTAYVGERGTSFDFDGRVDELLISSAARSGAWVQEEYDQSNSQSTFWGTWAWTEAGGSSIPIFMHHYLQMRGA